MIHISSLLVPLSYYYLDRNVLLIILLIFSVSMVLTDIVRRHYHGFGRLYDKHLKDILRNHEKDKDNIFLTGGTFIVISFFLCVLLFQKEISILSMMIIVVCDTAAAIIGMTLGKHKIGSKTLEGSISFFVTAVILFFLVIKPGNVHVIYLGIISVILTTVFELLPLKIDDNISIPLFFGIIYSVLTKSNFLI